jgi:hypothetical protein
MGGSRWIWAGTSITGSATRSFCISEERWEAWALRDALALNAVGWLLLLPRSGSAATASGDRPGGRYSSISIELVVVIFRS